ncbi:MAG: hypothetical protein RL623_575 [Actinomycetota bacterium]|jgi:uncharacterized protein (TIGR01777 family)
MKIVISGASGLIGTQLVKHLAGNGHEVVRLVRRSPKAGEVQWNPKAGTLDAAALEGADAVIHLSGAGIGDKRWTNAYRKEILDSRTQTTALLANTIASLSQKPKVFLSGSAIGIYGARNDEQLTEVSTHGTGFLADVCEQWEAAAKPAVDAGVRTVFLRTGIVLTPKGGALKKLLPLFKLGVGGKFGNGKQWQSWISIDDEIGAIEHLLTANVSGAVNLTAPNPVTNAEFTKVLASVLKRPAIVPVPAFAPKIVLGGELADALLFTGQRVIPAALNASGYVFKHSTLESALRSLLSK